MRGHYQIDKQPRDFDFAKWMVEHTELLTRIAQELKADGWTVRLENQNDFKLTGNTAVIGGKPDIVATKGQRVRVVDAKSGAERDANAAQVAIYMILLPMVRPDLYGSAEMEGAVVYKTSGVPVSAADIEPLRPRLFQLIRDLAEGPRPEPIPSANECRFCDVTAKDCPQRFGEGAGVPVTTSEF
jgi:CRISPR/Cas system-associated exonuclease Cas4 (RecB family)